LVWLDRSSHSLLSPLLLSRRLELWLNAVVVTAVAVEASTVEVAAEAGSTGVVVFTVAVVAEVSAAVGAAVSVAAVAVEDSEALAEEAFVAVAAFAVDPRQVVSE
jgi:hypothetical protein